MQQSPSVAIVGIGGIFPDAPELSRFWDNIRQGRSAAREVPDGRWLIGADAAYSPQAGESDRVYSRRGCFIEEIPPVSDLSGLSIDTRGMTELDPLFHLLLHAGKRAFDDGVTAPLDLTRVGVIIGNLALPSETSTAITRQWLGRCFEEKLLGKSREHLETDPLNRYVAGLPAGLLAAALGLGAGSCTLDAACASSLYAIKLAADELLSGRADAMLTGGLSRPDPLYTQMGFSQLRALSSRGICSPFDAAGDGLVVGEGAGIFLLKRTEDAVAHGDRIYGVIRGIGLSNDVGGSLLAPLSEGQLRAMRAAYRQAGWQPWDLDLIECHATGTPVGDATEVASLKELWGTEVPPKKRCVIGSVKSNIGHLLTAAGAAALTKVLLAMSAKTLPPTANFVAPQPGFDLDNSPFRILKQAAPWHTRGEGIPRRAAVSAFGFGGINAHLLVEEWIPGTVTPPIESNPIKRTEVPTIAVVGMDARFGSWQSLDSFQRRVLGSDRGVEPETPHNWWGAQECSWFAEEQLDDTSFAGYYLADCTVETDTFRIPPREMEEMLPQQLLMLQSAAQAMSDAGLARSGNQRTGVFIGIALDLNSTNFSFRWSIAAKVRTWASELGLDLTDDELAAWTAELRDQSGPPLTANRTMGALGSVVASRIAREFRAGGPSFTLSSEESSGIRALHTAVRQLQSGEIDRAIVGAVDLAGDLRAVLGHHRERPFSEKGRALPFDETADGSIVGEGAACVVLKRLEDAKQGGDRIYAVIKGVGMSGGDLRIPGEAAYSRALERAYREAGFPAETVGYLEAHGSGLPVEDRMEASALAHFFAPVDNGPAAGNAKRRLAVSSVKGEIGHCGAASGLAAFVRGCLALYHEIIPSHVGGGNPLPGLTGEGPLYLPSTPRYWLRNRAEGARRAGISIFGVDGSTGHIVLEGWEGDPVRPAERVAPLGPGDEFLFSVTGMDQDELHQGLDALLSRSGEDLAILAEAWHRGERAASDRPLALSLVARSNEELAALVDQGKRLIVSTDAGNEAVTRPALRDRLFYSASPLGTNGKIAFVFPGSGNHYTGMGMELSAHWPGIYRRQDAENLYLKDQFQPAEFWNGAPMAEVDDNHLAVIFGQVATGCAMSDLVQSFGVHPEAVIGYSLGESAGLFSQRAWRDRDLMLSRMRASTLFTRDLAGECRAARSAWGETDTKEISWCIGMVDAPARDVRRALKKSSRVYLLIVNTPDECVIGGDLKWVKYLVATLGCNFFPLKGVTTVHCEVARQVADQYLDLHLFSTIPPAGVTFYSGAAACSYQVNRRNAAESILAQAVDGIDFPKLIEAAYADGVRHFLEMGPGNSCSRMIGRILAGRPHLARSACFQGMDSRSSLLRLLAQLIAERVSVDLEPLFASGKLEVQTSMKQKAASKFLHLALGGSPFNLTLPPRRQSAISDRSPALQSSDAALSLLIDVVEPSMILPVTATETPAASDHAYVSPAFTLNSAPAVNAMHPEEFGESHLDPLLQEFAAAQDARVKAHEAYLVVADSLNRTIAENLAWQISLQEQMVAAGIPLDASPPPIIAGRITKAPATALADHIRAVAAAPDALSPPAFDRALCLEFARGSVGRMLGPAFAEADSFPTRVRLPDVPLMLVDRIVTLEGEPKSMTSGRVVTEHDILPEAWYLDGGRIPTCIAVEAGQADLFLSGYLGIDFITRGMAVYRLLDAVVTFHRGLPGPGETITYDIRIERFFRQGDTYLFRFYFEATVNGEPLLSMHDGCAGFFSAAELEAGKGIVRGNLDLRPTSGKLTTDWVELVPMAIEAYDAQKLERLREGDLAGCFGPLFAALGLKRPLTIPGGRMELVHRVSELIPKGGRYGLGFIRAEADIHPDDWFLTCHFVDDRVMPGTLMYECCLHTLRIFLIRMGWVAESEGSAWEPVPGVASRLSCRGQVLESTRIVTYEVSVRELDYCPEPYAVVDALMYADGRPIVEISNMSVRLAGTTKEQLTALWQKAGTLRAPPMTVTAEQEQGRGKQRPCINETINKPVLYTKEQILAYSNGRPSEGFGEPYRIFDSGRKIARLPGPPFQFMDRITDLRGEPWQMVPGTLAEAQYDVPPNAWYFAAERQPRMPFSILLEAALQPCGWLAAYVGSALTSPTDIAFRNLGGNAIQQRAVTPESGTLTATASLTKVATSGGMIIQEYNFAVKDRYGILYEGETMFGFFAKEALANQVGIRDSAPYQPSQEENGRGRSLPYPTQRPFPEKMLRMIDRIELFVPDGGPHGLGYLKAGKDVDPDEWFFKAHFYQDPVTPGSLGLESFLQLLKFAAVERWGWNEGDSLSTVALNQRHRWLYRGQVVPGNKKVTVEAWISAADDRERILRADGFLSVDGRTIYQMNDFTVKLERK